MSNQRVITLKGCPEVTEEFQANEAISPGHLLGFSSGKLIKNTSNANKVAPMFALERDELGKDVDEAYAADDYVKAGTFAPGMRLSAFIASGQTVAIGDYLTGDAAGRLTKTGVDNDTNILAQAMEAITTTGVDTGANRISVQIV